MLYFCPYNEYSCARENGINRVLPVVRAVTNVSNSFMEILNLDFEKSIILTLGESKVTITAFKSLTPGAVCVGVDAPKKLSVNREEIHKKKESEQI